ncbi:hypothetical protein HJFPF1_09937 [Paramyrothecium foliicola]|nr:hypothetical protein HJFPF1_09937 [Paramyrothecium foliicola]
MAAHVHVVSKRDISKHTALSVQLPAPEPLAPSSVRVRSKVLGLTANNFTYAKLGSILHWWDAYPVPSGLPSPYHDDQQWGIVPAWGYAEVLESTVEAVPTATWLWGFWPTSTHALDLKLESAGAEGHFVEVSEARKRLMSLYNAYSAVAAPPPEEIQGWTASVFPIWSAGYILNRFVFPDNAGPRVHPLGQGSWGEQDIDLTSAVVVSLSATTKTGMGFAWNLAQRDLSSGPLALLQATSSPENVPKLPSDQLKHKVVSYADLPGNAVVEWLANLKPSRIVLLDFGAPAGTPDQFGASVLPKVPPVKSYTIIGVGSEPVLQPAVASGASVSAGGPEPERIRLNTSGVLDAANDIEGIQASNTERLKAFGKWIEGNGMGSMQLIRGQGISGEDSLEKAWDELINGSLPRNKALSFRL